MFSNIARAISMRQQVQMRSGRLLRNVHMRSTIKKHPKNHYYDTDTDAVQGAVIVVWNNMRGKGGRRGEREAGKNLAKSKVDPIAI